MAVSADAVAGVVDGASGRAASLGRFAGPPKNPEGQGGEGPPSGLDVWSHTLGATSQRIHEDPRERDRALAAGLTGEWAAADLDGVLAARGASREQLFTDFENLVGLGEPTEAAPELGVLGTVGATFGLLTTLEQVISTAFSAIPFPAFPALRVMDMDLGLPHAHNHPPNLVPPAPPVPFPSTGPIIPIPFLSGANQTLINGMPAARCGDMGLAIWCGGYFPMYEVFLGSSSVWIEGARAGRLLVDITHHCIFSAPKPSDPPLGPPVGMTLMGSPNVLIGGVPLPSLLDLAMGAAMKGLFSAFGKAVKKIKANRLAKAARGSGGSARAFSRTGKSKFPFETIWDFHPTVIKRVFTRDFRQLRRKLAGPVTPTLPFKTKQAEALAKQRVQMLLKKGVIEIDPAQGSAFRKAVIRDLEIVAGTKAGDRVLQEIASNKVNHGTRVSITRPRKPTDPNTCGWDGSPSLDPKTGKPGNPENAIIRYDPLAPRRSPGSTSDCTLIHEASHASRAGRGELLDKYPLGEKTDVPRWTDPEEVEAIQIENLHRAERDLPLRDGHDDWP